MRLYTPSTSAFGDRSEMPHSYVEKIHNIREALWSMHGGIRSACGNFDYSLLSLVFGPCIMIYGTGAPQIDHHMEDGVKASAVSAVSSYFPDVDNVKSPHVTNSSIEMEHSVCWERLQSATPSRSILSISEAVSTKPRRGRRRQHAAAKGAYKTELCRCIIEGTHCRFGAQRCKWAHSLQELIDRRNESMKAVPDQAATSYFCNDDDAVVENQGGNGSSRHYSLNEPLDMRNLLPTSIWAELLVTSCDSASPKTSSCPTRSISQH